MRSRVHQVPWTVRQNGTGSAGGHAALGRVGSRHIHLFIHLFVGYFAGAGFSPGLGLAHWVLRAVLSPSQGLNLFMCEIDRLKLVALSLCELSWLTHVAAQLLSLDVCYIGAAWNGDQ